MGPQAWLEKEQVRRDVGRRRGGDVTADASGRYHVKGVICMRGADVSVEGPSDKAIVTG